MANDRTLAVIGAGNMGSGIAQKMATEGFQVLLVDLDQAALDRGRANIDRTLAEAVERKILTEAAAREVGGRITATTDWNRLAAAELVVEAVFENLEVKKEVFRKLSAATRPETILGTNTSSFYVKDLAAVVDHPERVVGLHYFYHPAKNRLVEVVPAEKTSPAAFRRAWTVQESIGKTPIACKDAPGFVVNRYFVPWLNESVRLLEEGVADIATIEAAAKRAFRIGMGPFELMNVTGVPIALHAAATLGRELGPFYAPARRLEEQVAKKSNWDLAGTPDESRMAAVEKRLLGVVFLVAGELLDEEVATIEDVDIGARVGLRWSKGPFELANVAGAAVAAGLAAELAARWERPLPKVLAAQAEAGRPFSFRLVEVERDQGTATLWINRPDAMNAINADVVAQLTAAFDQVDRDPEVKAIVIAGKGKGFIAGADIRFFVKNIEKKDLAAIETFTRKGHELLARFAASRKPVIARVDGLSLGGGSEIALACDWIVATDKGSFGFPETGIGIYPGLGGTQRLARRIGTPLARWLVLTGAPVDAGLGQKLGMVDERVAFDAIPAAIGRLAARGKRPQSGPVTERPVPAGLESLARHFDARRALGDLAVAGGADAQDPAVQKAVKVLGFKAPVALRLADHLIVGFAGKSLDEGLAAELKDLHTIFSTKDAYEGLSTLGKSRPSFRGE